jgi:putative transposase
MLRAEGFPINRKRVQRLTRQMGIAALGPEAEHQQTRTCDRAGELALGGGHHLHSDRARLSLSGGDHRLASRAVLSWRLSNTMDVSFCIAALEEALAKYGAPKIFNTDQDGRTRALDGQRLHRAAVALAQA